MIMTMIINSDDTITINEQVFIPQFKGRSYCDIRWLEDIPYPEIYGAGGVWLPLQKEETQ